MILPILQWPDGRLHEIARYVGYETKDQIAELVRDLFDTMYAAGGIGLSAIQVGVPLRVFVMDVTGDHPRTFINPEIVKLQGQLLPVEEGCLSLPGIYENVQRYPEVVVDVESIMSPGADDAVHTVGYALFLEGLEAQCFQHEFEHLDGKVFIQKLPLSKREQIRKKLKLSKRRLK